MKNNITSKTMPFYVPKDYFSSVHKDIVHTISSLPESTEVPKLDLLSNPEPEKVPQGYFNSLQENVMAQLHKSSESSTDLISNSSLETPEKYFNQVPQVPKKPQTIRLYSPWRIVTNMAATFLVLIGIGLLYIKPSTENTSPTYALQTVDASDWEQFLENEGDMEYEGNDPIVNLEFISEQEVKQFLQEEEEYLDI